MFAVTAQNQPNLIRSISDGSNNAKDAPNLQALLSAEVEPSTANVGVSGSAPGGGSLLERLVRDGTSPSTSSVASPAGPIRSSADSTNEITLAALLSKPVQTMSPLAASSPGSQMGSPTKASPLIQG